MTPTPPPHVAPVHCLCCAAAWLRLRCREQITNDLLQDGAMSNLADTQHLEVVLPRQAQQAGAIHTLTRKKNGNIRRKKEDTSKRAYHFFGSPHPAHLLSEEVAVLPDLRLVLRVQPLADIVYRPI